MVALRWPVNLRKLARGSPVELTAIYDDATHGSAMTINPLCCRVNDNVGTPLKWVTKVTTRTKGVIYDKWDIVALQAATHGMNSNDYAFLDYATWKDNATGSTSGILKAADPYAMVEEMLYNLRKAWDEMNV